MQSRSAMTSFGNELVDAALRGPSEVLAQPISTLTGKLVALEALARFEVAGPGEVFAAAAAAGLRVEAELAATAVALELLERIDDEVRLSINVAASTLATRELVELLLPVADRLWVEVTEVERVDRRTRATAHANELRDAGATIVVDDAGAQYSTARQALVLAADVLKLDRDLVLAALAGERLEEFTELLETARSLEARVVAEGVESVEDCRRIEALGADLLQGWAIGRPAAI